MGWANPRAVLWRYVPHLPSRSAERISARRCVLSDCRSRSGLGWSTAFPPAVDRRQGDVAAACRQMSTAHAGAARWRDRGYPGAITISTAPIFPFMRSAERRCHCAPKRVMFGTARKRAPIRKSASRSGSLGSRSFPPPAKSGEGEERGALKQLPWPTGLQCVWAGALLARLPPASLDRVAAADPIPVAPTRHRRIPVDRAPGRCWPRRARQFASRAHQREPAAPERCGLQTAPHAIVRCGRHAPRASLPWPWSVCRGRAASPSADLRAFAVARDGLALRCALGVFEAFNLFKSGVAIPAVS